MQSTRVAHTNAATPLEIAGRWDHDMHKILGATPLHDKALVQHAEEYAKRLGIHPPRLYIAESFPPFFGGKMPNAMAFPSKDITKPTAIAFTRKLFTVHKYTPHSSAAVAVPNEVLFLLGHEMGHAKQGGTYLEAIRRYPRLIGAVGAMAGLYLLHRAIEKSVAKQKEDAVSDETIHRALGEVTQEEHTKMKELLHHAADSHKADGPLNAIATTLHAITQTGEYLAAAALGSVAGRFATRQLMLNVEFEADRIGATLCGDPRAGIRSLQSIMDYVRGLPSAELKTLRRKISTEEMISGYFEHAHPTMEQRFAQLEKMAKKMEGGVATMMHHCKTGFGSILEHAPTLLKELAPVAEKIHLN